MQTSGLNYSEEEECPFGNDALKSDNSRSSSNLLSMLRQEANANTVPNAKKIRVERLKLREQMKTFLAAGYESSSLTLTWAILMIARNPDVEARLASERLEVLRGRQLVHSDLPKLNYARAVIQETLRLYPPLWMTGETSRSGLRDRRSKNSCWGARDDQSMGGSAVVSLFSRSGTVSPGKMVVRRDFKPASLRLLPFWRRSSRLYRSKFRFDGDDASSYCAVIQVPNDVFL